MEQQHGPWWEGVFLWLQEQAIPLLTAGFSLLLGYVSKNALFRSGMTEMRADWHMFLDRYEASEKERAEFRYMQESVLRDVCERLARMEARVEVVSQESLDEQRRLFRLLREDNRGYHR